MSSQGYINLPPPAGFPFPRLAFFRVRPEDVERPSDSPLTSTEFKNNRRDVIYSMDLKIWEAFSARMTLIESLRGDSFYLKEREMRLFKGLDAFEEKWKQITRSGGGRAASILARAALFTTNELREFGMDDDFLHCCYRMGLNDSGNDTQSKVKWPKLGALYPELSPWVLAPIHSERSAGEIIKLIKRECPDLSSQGENIDIDSIEVNKQSWDTYMEHGRLLALHGNRDSSKKMLIGNEKDVVELTSQVILNGAVRMFTISTFLIKVVELSFRDICSECNKPGDDLKRCTRCLSAFYCGKECQVANFKKSHKRECKILKELQSWYDSETPLPQHDKFGVYMTLESFIYPDLRDAVILDLKDAIHKEVEENRMQSDGGQRPFGNHLNGSNLCSSPSPPPPPPLNNERNPIKPSPFTRPSIKSKPPNISNCTNDSTRSNFCRVTGLTSEEGKKKNGSVGYANTEKKIGSGPNMRHPVCLDGHLGPLSIKARNLELYPEDAVLRASINVSVGRLTFFDTRFTTIIRSAATLDEEVILQSPMIISDRTPIMTGKTARTRGNLEAMEILVRKYRNDLMPGLVVVNLTDLNLARALNMAAHGKKVKLAAPLNKQFQRIVRMFPKDSRHQKVMVKYDPNRLWPDKFGVDLQKLGTQRYEAAKLGTYQIYPSSHPDNLDALEVLYADGSGKRKACVVLHEIYQDYGFEEVISYARHASAMKEVYRLFPLILAGVDPQAFWSALLWVEHFIKTLEKLELPSELVIEWKNLNSGRGKSLEHFKESMEISRFDPALFKTPEENWGIGANQEQHYMIATDYAICAVEGIKNSLRCSESISSVVIRTNGQFRGTEMWRYINGTALFREMKEEEQVMGREMTVERVGELYHQCMESRGFSRDSKHWLYSPNRCTILC